ncbi:hypothetical protein LUZ60_017067 [Juncus effusus]|nr:hypothetical protein LUZ60_017067 [Juncus effusus]
MAISNRFIGLLLLWLAFNALVPIDAFDPSMEAFEQWIQKYGQVYENEQEKLHRFEIFKKNFNFIEYMNNQPGLTYTMSLNKFADLTDEEFKTRYIGIVSTSPSPSQSTEFMYQDVQAAPSSVDWRSMGAVTPIKDQNKGTSSCGSCWAFSTVAAIEGITKIKTGILPNCSEQELVDCVTTNDMCKGGYVDLAFQWVITNGGITSEADYPYLAQNGTCNTYKMNDYVASISDYQSVPNKNQTALMNAVANQPVSVYMYANETSIRFYDSGIYNGPCDADSVNHAVTIVGYGTNSTGSFWIVKNSWGTSFGAAGYLYMQRNVSKPEGLCNIARYSGYYPIF